MLKSVRVLAQSNDSEMIACFLSTELTSPRFGPALRASLADVGLPEELLTAPDLSDPQANQARRELLAATRGYGVDRGVFENFPLRVRWVRALLRP
ncbi:MAG: hypothetical protein ACLP0J_08240 [Solirubrobacteraceae bacterium]|jgi:hypothetical protein